MIESLREDLPCHRGAPDKLPARRLATLEWAGELKIPFTTGILVGIGEDRAGPDRRAAGDRRLPRAPRPRAGGDRPELPAQAGHRDARPPAVPGGGPPGRDPARARDPPARRARAGPAEPGERHERAAGRRASTTGAACPRSPPTSSTPSGRGRRCERLREATEAAGKQLAPRLAVYPEFIDWVHPDLRFATIDRADAEGLGRDDPGARAPAALRGRRQRRPTAPRSSSPAAARPPGTPAPTPQPTELPLTGEPRGAIKEVLDGARAGQELGLEEIVTLFSRARHGRRRRRRSSPTSCAARPRRHGHVRPHPQHQLHEPVHLQVQVLRVREGPAAA